MSRRSPSRTSSTASANLRRDRRDGGRDHADLFGDSGQDAWRIRRHQPQDRRHHRCDAERHGSWSISQAQHPDRYFDVGIAEEHAALFACGLATQGLKPFLTIYSTFMQRAYDMIIHDMALQNLNVALCMDRAGLSGDDGPTHHGLFDIGYLRHVPNIVHMQPKDEDEFVDMLWTMANYSSGPIAVRYPRGAGTGAKPKAASSELLEIGKAEVVQHGPDVAIFGLGNMFEMAEEAAGSWRRRASPSASSTRAGSSRSTPATLEFFARSVRGGLHDRGSRPAQRLRLRRDGASRTARRITTPVVRIGWPDQFIEHGTIPILRKKHGITAEHAVEKIVASLPVKKGIQVKPAA